MSRRRAAGMLGLAADACGGQGLVKSPSALRSERTPTAAVDLYWIPLGAGGHSVRFNGKVFEAIQAARRHRPRRDLYHAALMIEVDGVHYAIEVAPSPDDDGMSRGVVASGAVGSRLLGRFRLFRYEVRCWPGGAIPDLAYAVGEPRRISDDPRAARRVLEVIGMVPTPVWGLDELDAGDMWNSNSVVAWSLATAGLPADGLRPPPRGRAPGWGAGLDVARRSSIAGNPQSRPEQLPKPLVAGRDTL